MQPHIILATEVNEMWIRRRYRRWMMYFAVFLIIIAVGLAVANTWLKYRIKDIQSTAKEGTIIIPLAFDTDPLSLSGYTKVKLGVSPAKIYLIDNCTAVTFATSLSKTYTVQRALENTLDIRPDAYDLIYDMMDNFAINIRFVKIYHLKGDLFYAQIFLEKDKQLLNIDAKPSDALAIASRFQVPIYVENSLLKEKGEKVC